MKKTNIYFIFYSRVEIHYFPWLEVALKCLNHDF